MSKKILALLLTVCLGLSVLSGCGGGTAASDAVSSAAKSVGSASAGEAANEAPTAAPEASAAEMESAEESVSTALWPENPLGPAGALPLTEEPVTMTMWMAINPNVLKIIDDPNTDCAIWAELAQRTGVNLDFITLSPDTQTEKFNLMVSSDDLTDIISGATDIYTGGGDAAIADGVLVDVSPYLTEEYAPQIVKLLENQDIQDALVTDEGHIAGLPCIAMKAERAVTMGPQIRQDWLDDLGLEKPKTLDQLHSVLTAFKDDKGATDGLFIPATGVSDYFTSAFGVASGMYLDGDTIKYGPLEDGYKEYLETMAQWYSDGLIYHDFPFYGEQLAFRDMDKIGSGAVACFYSETGDMASFKDFSNDENFLLTAMAPVSKEDGGTIYMSDKKPSRADDVRWAVTTGCEDPELLISFVDYLYSDEGALLCNYGIEGETFNFDADGVPHFSDLIYNNPTYDYRTAVFIYVMDSGPTVVDPMRGTGTYTQEQLDSWDQWQDANLDYSHVVPNKVVLEAENAEYNNVKSDIDTFLDEMTVKYITGEYSFDNYETDFVEALKGMNADRLVELYQDAYDNYVG